MNEGLEKMTAAAAYGAAAMAQATGRTPESIIQESRSLERASLRMRSAQVAENRSEERISADFDDEVDLDAEPPLDEIIY